MVNASALLLSRRIRLLCDRDFPNHFSQMPFSWVYFMCICVKLKNWRTLQCRTVSALFRYGSVQRVCLLLLRLMLLNKSDLGSFSSNVMYCALYRTALYTSIALDKTFPGTSMPVRYLLSSSKINSKHIIWPICLHFSLDFGVWNSNQGQYHKVLRNIPWISFHTLQELMLRSGKNNVFPYFTNEERKIFEKNVKNSNLTWQ